MSYIRVRDPQLLHAAGAIPPRHDPGNRKVTCPARRRQDPSSSAAAILEPAASCFPPVAHRVCIWGFQSARDRAPAAGAMAFPVLVLRRACVLSCTLWSLLFVALISFVVHHTHFIKSDFTVFFPSDCVQTLRRKAHPRVVFRSDAQRQLQVSQIYRVQHRRGGFSRCVSAFNQPPTREHHIPPAFSHHLCMQLRKERRGSRSHYQPPPAARARIFSVHLDMHTLTYPTLQVLVDIDYYKNRMQILALRPAPIQVEPPPRFRS